VFWRRPELAGGPFPCSDGGIVLITSENEAGKLDPVSVGQGPALLRRYGRRGLRVGVVERLTGELEGFGLSAAGC
jgi:hypothetical protein